MTNGWTESADAWIAEMGERGDFAREFVLDPVMLGRIRGRGFEAAVDVGCGEGRFCRMMRGEGIAAIGIEPAAPLLEEARRRDPGGDYRGGIAEALPLADASVDLAVSYLTLLDIADMRAAIAEMARVLKPGGTLLIANLASFVTAGGELGWQGNAHFAFDRYLDERPQQAAWRGIRVVNWHRPLGAYMQALLGEGLQLVFFDEPEARGGEPDRVDRMRRVPWFVVMEWRKPAAP